MIQIEVKETDFFLPEDSYDAEIQFLELLKSPGETWICAYGFTLQPMFDEIKKADQSGVKIHILLDHTQEAGKAEKPLVQDLVNSMKNGDVTITTAGVNSKKPSQIWHLKSMVVSSTTAAHETSCWEGSTNFSASAWYQGNSARVFESNTWAQVAISQFNLHKAWALANEAKDQVLKTN